MLMVRRLVEVLDRIQCQLWRQGRFRHLSRTRHLVKFERRAVLGVLVVGKLETLDRDQLLALEGTDHDLLSVGIVRDDRRDQVGQNRLQQKAHDQHPGGHRPL